MIRAHRHGFLGALVRWYATQEVRRTFRGVWLKGPRPEGGASVIFYANHRSYWDAFAGHALVEHLGFEGYGLMHEANLAKYRFLTRLGAFSIRPNDARSAVESLRYARALLQNPKTGLLIFPEGEQRPLARAPLKLAPGVATLSKSSKARCVPVGMSALFLEDEKPDLLIELGPAHEGGPLGIFQDALDDVVRRVDSATSTQGFECIVRGKESLAQRFRRAREDAAKPRLELLGTARHG